MTSKSFSAEHGLKLPFKLWSTLSAHLRISLCIQMCFSALTCVSVYVVECSHYPQCHTALQCSKKPSEHECVCVCVLHSRSNSFRAGVHWLVSDTSTEIQMEMISELWYFSIFVPFSLSLFFVIFSRVTESTSFPRDLKFSPSSSHRKWKVVPSTRARSRVER